MAALDNIPTQNLLYRFMRADEVQEKPALNLFTELRVPLGLQAINAPQYVQFEPFKYGYSFSFMANLREQIDIFAVFSAQNRLIEILAPHQKTKGLYYRIGDKYGFAITDFSQLFSACPENYTLTFSTVRPAKSPYEILNYTQYN